MEDLCHDDSDQFFQLLDPLRSLFCFARFFCFLLGHRAFAAVSRACPDFFFIFYFLFVVFLFLFYFSDTKCVRYALRADELRAAEETVSLFLRDGDGLKALEDLQVMWYESQSQQQQTTAPKHDTASASTAPPFLSLSSLHSFVLTPSLHPAAHTLFLET